MFAYFASAIVLSVALTAAGGPAAGDQSYCNSGSVQCCNSVQSVQQTSVQQLELILSQTGMGPSQLTGLVGVTCTPVDYMGNGSGGNSCNSQTVCCDNRNFNGVIAIGCMPINISL
ncbi:hypothetical protein AMATHDRAFT_9044 [Amanita thiersii Skay4041]|uniref:Hydrophobin n=1 Tax=Amanita thiersii Skay4041 TaxID=703135 RepID=A0A2A9NCT0_9AGAR|nr:hypothetical protein AMATHDRAFT_9044 [Amanita thiersii Skay4041]